jgi:hypothetical protein
LRSGLRFKNVGYLSLHFILKYSTARWTFIWGLLCYRCRCYVRPSWRSWN